MIIVQFSGGLGNQLSQYALYRQYRAMGLDCYADLSCYGKARPKDDNVTPRKIELQLLGLDVQSCPHVYEYFGNEGLPGRLMRRIGVGPTCLEKDYKFTPELLRVKKGYVMGGCFLGEQYIPDCADDIRESIRFAGTDDPYVQSMEKKIRDGRSVSIHLRLGDYLNLQGLYGGICTAEYYKRAIDAIRKKIPNPAFYLFSNDVDKAMKLLDTEDLVPVDGNTGDRSYLDMYLMSICEHNIIANSTFSWWGAWLNRNQEKMVFCPTTLLKGYDNGSVYPEGWIRISS